MGDYAQGVDSKMHSFPLLITIIFVPFDSR